MQGTHPHHPSHAPDDFVIRFEHVRKAWLGPEFLGNGFFRGRHTRSVPWRQASAIASISTSAPAGSFETSTVARAGGNSPTCRL